MQLRTKTFGLNCSCESCHLKTWMQMIFVVQKNRVANNCHSQVDSFVHWALTDRGDSCLIECFVRTLKTCAGRGEFADGIPVASMCSGWGVAEMVIDRLNDKLSELRANLPKVRFVASEFSPFCVPSLVNVQIDFFRCA